MNDISQYPGLRVINGKRRFYIIKYFVDEKVGLCAGPLDQAVRPALAPGVSVIGRAAVGLGYLLAPPGTGGPGKLDGTGRLGQDYADYCFPWKLRSL